VAHAKPDEGLAADKVDSASRALQRLDYKRTLERIPPHFESMKTLVSAQLKAPREDKVRLKRC